MKRIHTVPISLQDFHIRLGRHSSMLSIYRLRCLARPRLPLVVLATSLSLLLLPLSVQEVGALEDASALSYNDGRRTLKRFPVNILRGATGVFSPESIRPLLVGSLLAGTGLLLDDEVRDTIADEDDTLADFAEDNTGPIGLGVLTLGLFIGGRFSEDPRFRDMSYDLAVAGVVNLGYTGALKATVSRERPNDEDENSFPSGHTSSPFAFASVASAHYGMKVGIPAYVAASAIGISRLRNDDHWLSDVVAGAALGSLVGWTVVRQNDRLMKDQGSLNRTVSIMPILGPGFLGVQAEVNF
jgi:hypothetical protein